MLQAERRLNRRLLENVSEKPNPKIQSKSDTFVPLLTQETKAQESTNNNSNVPLESQYSPEVQLKYKDANAHTTSTSQAANDNVNVDKKITATSSSREPKTPFVPGFQTLGRNYNMPDYLIQWQADQFNRSERRHRQELARQGRLDEAVNDCPVYLSKETGKVPPMPVVRSKSTQVKAAEVGQTELGHAVQKEKPSPQKVSSNKAKATKTKKVTFCLMISWHGDGLTAFLFAWRLCLLALFVVACSCIFTLLTILSLVCVIFCFIVTLLEIICYNNQWRFQDFPDEIYLPA